MTRISVCFLGLLAGVLVPEVASAAVKSAELYSANSYAYGRFEARVRYAAGDGVISSFFLWKDGSERAGTFWNELDFEKLGADCHLETNAYYGSPAVVHSQKHTQWADLCTEFHTYAYEWTPDSIAWLVDGVELRRETGATAAAYADNASAGMQIRFNIWPGDASFGGNFSPSILPVYQQIDWVQYSSYADGVFTLEWRDDFDAETLDSRWLLGSWASPKNLSTHDRGNLSLVDGNAVLALTRDDAAGGVGGVGGASSQGGAAGAATTPGNGDSGDGCSTKPGRPSGTSGIFLLAALATVSWFARRRSRAASPHFT